MPFQGTPSISFLLLHSACWLCSNCLCSYLLSLDCKPQEDTVHAPGPHFALVCCKMLKTCGIQGLTLLELF